MDAIHAECRNCHNSLNKDDKFCSKCGQNTDTHKINLHYVIHELIHGILHLDGGILYTTKALFTKPGIMIREYLEGKRKNHFSPIIYIVILSTIMSLVMHYVYDDKYIEFSLGDTGKQSEVKDNIFRVFSPVFTWVSKHFTLIYLIQIPLMAFSFYIPFKKMSKYSYFEWLLIISFCIIQLMLITITFQLLNRLMPGIIFFSNLFVFSALTWTILQLFSRFDLGKVIMNYVLSLLILFLSLSAITVGFLFNFLSSNPNLIQQ